MIQEQKGKEEKRIFVKSLVLCSIGDIKIKKTHRLSLGRQEGNIYITYVYDESYNRKIKESDSPCLYPTGSDIRSIGYASLREK